MGKQNRKILYFEWDEGKENFPTKHFFLIMRALENSKTNSLTNNIYFKTEL